MPMSPALTDLFQRMLDEMDGRESSEWDSTEHTLDPEVWELKRA